ILSHHGGMKTVREKLGHVYTEPAMKKFKDFDEVKKVLDDLETRLGRFPTQKDIAAEKIVGFVSAVADYHGGLLKIAKKLGKPLTQQERGHWTLERTVALYKEFVQEYKHSPTNDELTNRTDKYAGLMSGINRYGRKKICEEAQLSMTKKANGYWTEERMLQTGREIVAKYGRLPLQKELAKSEYSDFLGAVANSIGLTKLRELLGLKIEKAGAGWWTKERILQEVKKIIAQNGDLPTKDELAHMGLQNLAGQIEANGGYPYFRKLAGLEYRQLPKGTWQKEEYAMEQAHKCMVELGRTELPSYGMMTKAKYTSLVQSIQKYHGGIVAFREKFNARFNISKPVGLEQVLSEYVA
ncbi:MAG TPA: hypothetical protein VK158_03765, partial [Acidobacteriota bacterium]|nr:hypothetical protein [Acidobacteriota bacterium]